MGGTQIRGGGLSPRLCKTSWCDPSFLVSCAGVVRSIEIYPARARTAVLPRRPSSTPPAPWTCCSGGRSHRWQGHFHAPCVRRMEKHERNIQRGTCGNNYTARGKAGSRGVHRRAHPGGPHGARAPPRRATAAPRTWCSELCGGSGSLAWPSVRPRFCRCATLDRLSPRSVSAPSLSEAATRPNPRSAVSRRAPRWTSPPCASPRAAEPFPCTPCTLRLFRPFTMCTTLF